MTQPDDNLDSPAQHFWTGKPRFYFVALATGCVMFILFAIQLVNTCRYSGYVAVPGWGAARQNSGWMVTRVDARGPADGLLQLGDRILAIDSDPRIGSIGPAWKLKHAPLNGRYSLDIARGGSHVRLNLILRVIEQPGLLLSALIEMIVALAFFATSMIIAVAKPNDRIGRKAFLVGILVTLYLLCISSNPVAATTMRGWPLWLSFAMGSVFPLYMVYSYQFYAEFPERLRTGPFWEGTGWTITLLGYLIWIPSTLHNIVSALNPDRSIPFVFSHQWFFRFHDAVVAPLEMLFLAICFVATLLVGLRNYRRVREGDARRRLRWVFGGLIGAQVPLILVSLFMFVARLLHRDQEWLHINMALALTANLLTVIMPFTLGYAILKHRVLGIHVFVRLGIQYLFAANVLRVLLFLPIAALTYTLVSNRDKTLGVLLFSSSAKWNLLLFAAVFVSMRYRRQLKAAIDKRFFREEYDREQILLALIDSVKQVDSIGEISGLLGAEIDSALHPRWLAICYLDGNSQSFSLSYSSGVSVQNLHLAALPQLTAELERLGSVQTWRSLRKRGAPGEASHLDTLGLNLLVPILNAVGGMAGVLFLGEKKSEDPYTARDRSLLEAVAGQIGVAYENLRLRGEIHRGNQVRAHVLARLEERNINLVKQCPSCQYCYDSTEQTCSRDGHKLALTLPVERTIEGKYRLEREIGRGGMGAVYEASDLRLKRTVAVKVMIGSLFGNSSALRRFWREAQASARLQHPNIVRIYDFGELTGQGAYLVLEHVSGITWREVLHRHGILRPDAARSALDQMLGGVEVAHRAGIVHRDLKPENILMSLRQADLGTVKILDFGLAKFRDAELSDPKSVTTPGVALGTLGYMSPEQLFGKDLDHRTDIYSLGVIALETLTGRLNIHGYSFHAQIDELLASRFEFTGVAERHLAVARILRKCLATDQNRRYATVTDMRRDLAEALQDCPPFPGAESGESNPALAITEAVTAPEKYAP